MCILGLFQVCGIWGCVEFRKREMVGNGGRGKEVGEGYGKREMVGNGRRGKEVGEWGKEKGGWGRGKEAGEG